MGEINIRDSKAIIREVLEFLAERGYENPRMVDFREFSEHMNKEENFQRGVNTFNVGPLTFDQAYGITKEGESVYVAIFRSKI